MIEPLPWMKREFTFDLPVGVFPALLERLRGTPARAKQLIVGISEEMLAARPNGKWSAKEHLGHLVDLRALDEQRLQEFLGRANVLSAADTSNRATEHGNHRQTSVVEILGQLRAAREDLVRKLEALTEEEVGISALHGRLQKPMRLIDWVYFVAEHDDHHFAAARRAILSVRKTNTYGHTGDEPVNTRTATQTPPTTATARIEDAKDLFEIPAGVTYLNCANMAPQLRSITDAGIDAVRAKATPWKLSAPEWFSGAEELRNLAATLLEVESDGVALVPGASYGIATAAANVPLSAGQTIILLHEEFPSNVYAWRELAKKKGGRIITVERKTGMNYTKALETAINRDTAIVALPQSHWTDGSSIDLERIGALVRSVGASLVIDASQSLGACSLNLSRVQPDFLVSVGYKWLLGPYGLGYLYVAPKWRDSGTPLEQSWLTRAGSEDFARLVEYRDQYRQGARRFDAGEFPQFVLVPMAIAALRQILSWKVARIEQALSFLTERVAGLAVENGYSVLPRSERCGHMIGIRHAAGIPAKLATSLREAKVFVSIRGDSIRVAPHLYNDLSDIDRLFEVLRAIAN